MITKELKTALLQECARIIDERYLRVKHLISDLEESLFEEAKSSAGDKHETARAMLQIERENAGKQLIEVENLQHLLKKVELSINSDHAHLGSLVHTSQGVFFISISVGAIEIEGKTYLAVAPNSPIGKLLIGKEAGDIFSFHDLEYKLTEVS